VGYVFTVALRAWCTFFAVVTPRRPHPAAMLSFVFGQILAELPFFGIYLVVAATALAWAEGDLTSSPAQAAVELAALTVVALGIGAWRGVRSDRAVSAALLAGLGYAWRERVTAPLRRHRPWARILLFPVPVAQPGVERIRNISYGPAGGRANLLDVYRRRDAPADAPVLVYFHGGGFRSGAKSREARPLLNRLARQGWVCVSANYRLRPETTFPGHQIDAKRVVAWVREHGAAYGADPSTVFVAGSSAGANMAATCALTPGDPTFQPGFESADTSVTAAVCLYGYYGHVLEGRPDDAPDPLQPGPYLNPDAPPFFVAHGTKDTWGTIEGARRFVARLRALSTEPVVFAELPGAQHSFDVFHSARFEAVVDGVEAFAAAVRSRQPAR
jgi:acetyl esterase/lipase